MNVAALELEVAELEAFAAELEAQTDEQAAAELAEIMRTPVPPMSPSQLNRMMSGIARHLSTRDPALAHQMERYATIRRNQHRPASSCRNTSRCDGRR